jgi:hypothetical protein
MTRLKLLPSALLVLIGVATALLPTVPLSADPPPARGVKLRPIGSPTWKPVDFHLFSAPVATPASGFAEFFQTGFDLLPPPNHVPVAGLGVGPGAPHQPPYDSELANGVAARGFREGVRFSTSEFSDGQGVFLAWMNVPAPGVTGSSPDFDSGPIIQNALFPISIVGETLHNNKQFSTTRFAVPALDDETVVPPFTVDGHSHFPIFIADNADIAEKADAKLRGSYRYEFTMIDSSGRGWRIEAHFAVAP